MDVRKKFFSRLKEVTQRDFADKDEGWEEATLVSTDQKTVHAVNQVMVQQYAKRTGVPVVAWRLPMADKYERRFGEQSEFLYDTVKDMTVFFAQGAPCSLTANLRPEKGLSNGTQAKLHSLLLSPNEPSSRADEIRDAAPGQVIYLEHPPFCVSAAVPRSTTTANGMEGSNEHTVLIPLMPMARKMDVHRYISVRNNKGKAAIMTSAHPFRLTFGCTYHGIQCRSMEKIILCVDRKCRPALTYNALYVGISRVHGGKNIRVLRLQEGSSGDDWRHPLLCLVPKVMVVKYMLHSNGYDRAHAHLVHLYAQHGIDYDHPIKLPPKEKDDETPKSFPCPQGCGRSFTAQGYLRMHLLKCKHRSVRDDSRNPDGSTTTQLDTLSLETLVIENVMCAEYQHEGDFDAAADIAREMLDDEGVLVWRRRGNNVCTNP